MNLAALPRIDRRALGCSDRSVGFAIVTNATTRHQAATRTTDTTQAAGDATTTSAATDNAASVTRTTAPPGLPAAA